MNLFIEVYRVNQFEKLAGMPVQELVTRKIDIWRQMKIAAMRDPQGVAVGLARQVLGHAADRLHTGEKLAADQSELITAAASIGSAHAVDLAIDRMLKTGELTRQEATKLSEFNVESVFFELGRLFKTAKSGCAHPDGSFCDKCKCPHDMSCSDCPTCRLSKAASEKTSSLVAAVKSAGLLGTAGRWGMNALRAVTPTNFRSALQSGVQAGRQAVTHAGEYALPMHQTIGNAARSGFQAFRRAGGGAAMSQMAMPAAVGLGAGYMMRRPNQPQQQRPQQPGMLPGM